MPAWPENSFILTIKATKIGVEPPPASGNPIKQKSPAWWVLKTDFGKRCLEPSPGKFLPTSFASAPLSQNQSKLIDSQLHQRFIVDQTSTWDCVSLDHCS